MTAGFFPLPLRERVEPALSEVEGVRGEETAGMTEVADCGKKKIPAPPLKKGEKMYTGLKP